MAILDIIWFSTTAHLHRLWCEWAWAPLYPPNSRCRSPSSTTATIDLWEHLNLFQQHCSKFRLRIRVTPTRWWGFLVKKSSWKLLRFRRNTWLEPSFTRTWLRWLAKRFLQRWLEWLSTCRSQTSTIVFQVSIHCKRRCCRQFSFWSIPSSSTVKCWAESLSRICSSRVSQTSKSRSTEEGYDCLMQLI